MRSNNERSNQVNSGKADKKAETTFLSFIGIKETFDNVNWSPYIGQ